MAFNADSMTSDIVICQLKVDNCYPKNMYQLLLLHALQASE